MKKNIGLFIVAILVALFTFTAVSATDNPEPCTEAELYIDQDCTCEFDQELYEHPQECPEEEPEEEEKPPEQPKEEPKPQVLPATTPPAPVVQPVAPTECLKSC